MKFIVLKHFVAVILFTTALYAKDTALDKVTLQLMWKHQFEFAGFYMAKEKGFYKDVGLDVKFLEYETGMNVIKSIAEGKSDFGVTYSDAILDSLSFQNIVILSAIYQSSPHVLLTLKSSDIKTLQDFKNKKIMISKSARSSAAFIAMFRANGLSLDDMTIVKPTYNNVESLIDGKADIVTSYISNEPYILKKKGLAYNIWDPKDYGFDLYNNIIITSRDELKQHPKRVENFRSASLKGFEYAFSHIDETIDVILQKYNTLQKTRDALLYEAKILKKLAYKDTDALGQTDKNKIQRIVDIYTILGLIHHKVNYDEMLYSMSLNSELTQEEKKYLKSKKQITMCVDPNWMPFEKLEDGKHVGMAADYFALFQKFIHVDIKLVPTKNWEESLQFAQERKCDILSLAMQTPSRKKYLNFTDPYLKIPIVMATKIDAPFTADFSSLEGKKVAIPKGYAFIEILKVKYPNLEVVAVENIEEGLEKVRQGEVFGYIGSLATIGYAFQNRYTGELKIAGKFDGTWDLGVAVRDDDPFLFAVFQKAVHSIPPSTGKKILNSWLSINYEKGVDYSLIWKITFVFLLVLLIIIFFYIKLAKLNKKIHKQKEALEYLASRDSLTKLYNRRVFEERAEEIANLAKRNTFDISVMMIDIDNFKRINDTYGHKVGDDVIVALAKTLTECSRKSDIVCRFGGEEFILLLPQTDKEGAYIIAQKIRKKVEKLVIDNKVHITVSIGVATVEIEKDNNIEESIKRADDALYKAKESGKNKVVTS